MVIFNSYDTETEISGLSIEVTLNPLISANLFTEYVHAREAYANHSIIFGTQEKHAKYWWYLNGRNNSTYPTFQNSAANPDLSPSLVPRLAPRLEGVRGNGRKE